MAGTKKQGKKTKRVALSERVSAVDYALAEEQPKSVLVGMAVSAQLSADGRWPPQNLASIMGADYRYTQFTMRNFLDSVKHRLATGSPPHNFDYKNSQKFIAAAVKASVLELVVAIDNATS